MLGVLSALEPRLCGMFHIFGKISSDPKRIAEILGILDLNLAKELEERAAVRTQQAEIVPLLPESKDREADTEYLN
ncbi:MAG: DUF5331 domain-containing protein [Cyanobacteriota bacterium]|nr:DUF5331 domain-containing protein [Cyanobacteriota bacterium]